MFSENERGVFVIPQWREQEGEHDEEADGARRDGQPGQ
jgi:hypothetical protein